MSLLDELKRRNVFRVAAAYLVVGWLLTEVLTTLMPAFGAPEWTSKAVMLVFALGFLPAVILSWIYEVTPDGVRKESDISADAGISRSTNRRLEYFTIAAVAAGILFIAIFNAGSDLDSAAPAVEPVDDASVAVLPFNNMSGSKDNEYFSDGLTETILHMLAQIPDLKVAARTSSFAFRDQNMTIGEIAEALEVSHVLEGSVQRSGDQVRITAQLIRADNGFHVWSKTYDRTLDDIFEIQDEIAEKVGGALSKSLLAAGNGEPIVGATTVSPDAYDLYLQALKERTTYSFGGLQAADALLKGALTIDPDFQDAKIELANNYWDQAETGLMGQESAYAEIIAIADQVLAVQPDEVNSRAIRLFAETALRVLQDGPQVMLEAIGGLEEIVAEAPAALQPKVLLTRLYQRQKKFEMAVPLMEDALERDPFNPRIYYELGWLYADLDRREDARIALQKSLEIEPASPNVYVTLAELSLKEGDGLDYLKYSLRALELDPVDHELPGSIAAFLYRLDLIEEGDDFGKRVMAIAPRSEIAYRIELLRAISSGDEEASVASARRAIEDDIDERRYAFGGAVQHLLRVAVSRGTVEEEIEYLRSQAPGILDIAAKTTPSKYRQAQFSAFDAWYVSLPRSELLIRLDRLQEIADAAGYDIEKYPITHVGILALQGKVAEAIDIALASLFSESVVANPGWQDTFSQAQFTAFVADPRIQSAMQRWAQEEAAVRGQVRTYLADLSAPI